VLGSGTGDNHVGGKVGRGKSRQGERGVETARLKKGKTVWPALREKKIKNGSISKSVRPGRSAGKKKKVLPLLS